MLVIYATEALKTRFKADAEAVRQAVLGLGGAALDVSGKTPSAIRDLIDTHPKNLPVLLIGGYDLVPTFIIDNPTADYEADEHNVFTDAPYGAAPGSVAEMYLPSRAVSRIPDNGGPGDAQNFIALLTRASKKTATPAGTFEQAAKEFESAAEMVNLVDLRDTPIHFSPPEEHGNPLLGPLVSNKGRLHILLHGASHGPRRDSLWGRDDQSGLIRAVDASDFSGFQLGGAIVTFSSCYSAMLEAVGAESPRTSRNQVALACLAAGAKAVYGCTRANWIDTLEPFDSFGSALTADIWRRLRQDLPVAEALRQAKMDFAIRALNQVDDGGWAAPYVFKTLLQTHCYGHPLATL